MRILSKGIKAAKLALRRQRLKRTERQLVREIRMAYADLDVHPDRTVIYFGEVIPDLAQQLLTVRAQLRKTPYEQTSALGNVHGKQTQLRCLPAPRPASAGTTTAPASPSAPFGARHASNASATTKPSGDLNSWDSATLMRVAC